MFKKINVFFLIVFSFITINIPSTLAEVEIWGTSGDGGVDTKSEIKDIGFTDVDPRIMVINGIRIFLSFLGLISVVLIIYAGFLWMTGGGDAEKVKKAKSIMSAALVGLLIILMSYGLAVFVLDQIKKATGSN